MKQRNWLDSLIIATIFLAMGFGAAKLWSKHGIDTGVEGQAPVVVVDKLPGKVDTDTPKNIGQRVVEKIKVVKVAPEVVYRTDTVSTHEVRYVRDTATGEYVAVESLEQVSYRDGRVRAFTHNDSSESRTDFRIGRGREYDLVMKDGKPELQVSRCFVCDPQLAAELGTGYAGVALEPFLSADLSVGVTSPSLRLFIRPTLNSEPEVAAGLRVVF